LFGQQRKEENQRIVQEREKPKEETTRKPPQRVRHLWLVLCEKVSEKKEREKL
jgi:hypothetical protein